MPNPQYENTGLATAKLSDRLIDVGWKNGKSSSFHTIWLRDNCRCERCGDPVIGRRNLRLTGLDLTTHATSVSVSEDLMKITWQDGHQSEYTGDWLHDYAYDDDSRQSRSFKPVLWNPESHSKIKCFDFNDIGNDDKLLLQALHQVRDFGLCFIRNSPAEPGILEKLALKIGYPQENNFGRVQDLVVDQSKSSIANDIAGLKLHTDEPYRASPPGILLFHCVETDTTGGGSSIFMDGFEIAERLRIHDVRGFDALCCNIQSFRRHFKNDVDLIAEFSVLSIDEFGNLCGIRLNDRVAAPLGIAPAEVETYYRGLKYLLELAEEEEKALKLTLQPGDIAIFDNHRILHGRTELTLTGKRWLQWIQIERGDFHSSLRIIADRLHKQRHAQPLLRGAYG